MQKQFRRLTVQVPASSSQGGFDNRFQSDAKIKLLFDKNLDPRSTCCTDFANEPEVNFSATYTPDSIAIIKRIPKMPVSKSRLLRKKEKKAESTVFFQNSMSKLLTLTKHKVFSASNKFERTYD